MFGFLSPRPHPDSYRHAYARVCVHLRQAFGLRALPFHSYEAVFLYQLALDAGAFPASVMPAVRCCKLARPGNLSVAPDAAHGRFAAAFALLLADIKLRDDIADSGSWVARGVRFVLKGRIRTAREHLKGFAPNFDETVNRFLTAHANLERRTDAIPLAEYVGPTASAFGYVFGLAAKLPGLDKFAEPLTAIGRGVGSALIAFDCAVDWQRDRRRGEYNPLPDEPAVRAAMRFAVNELDEVAELCRRTFGHASTAARTATAVADRLATRNPLVGCAPVPLWKQVLAMFRATPLLAMAGPNRDTQADEPTYGMQPPDATPEEEDGKKPWRKKRGGDGEKKDPPPPGDGKQSSSSSRDDTCCGLTCCAAEGGASCCECCAAAGACA